MPLRWVRGIAPLIVAALFSIAAADECSDLDLFGGAALQIDNQSVVAVRVLLKGPHQTVGSFAKIAEGKSISLTKPEAGSYTVRVAPFEPEQVEYLKERRQDLLDEVGRRSFLEDTNPNKLAALTAELLDIAAKQDAYNAVATCSFKIKEGKGSIVTVSGDLRGLVVSC